MCESVCMCVSREACVLVDPNPFWSILFNVGLNRPTPHFTTILLSIAVQVCLYVSALSVHVGPYLDET